MKRFIKFINNRYNALNFSLVSLLLLSLFTIVDIRLRLIEIPELFNRGSLFEADIYNVSIAYIASFIFYVLVEYIPALKKRKKFRFYVNNQVREILDVSADVVDAIVKNSTIDRTNYLPTKNELEKIYDDVKTTDKSNRAFFTSEGGMQKFSVWEVIMQCPPKVIYIINRISIRTPEFDENLDALLMKLEECSFFAILDQVGINFKSSNLKVLSKIFNEYLDILIELSDYTNRKYGSTKLDKMFNEVGLPKR